MSTVIQISLGFLIMIVGSCSPVSSSSSELTIKETPDVEALADPINVEIVTKYKGKEYPTFFEAAFVEGTHVETEAQHFDFSSIRLGKINVVSGKMIACDPILMHDGIAFTQTFPVGEYPVDLSLAVTKWGSRVALSRILFSEEEVVNWEFALLPGQHKMSIKDTAFYCYGVDAGAGIFIDSVANFKFNLKPESYWESVFVDEAEDNKFIGHMHEFDGYNLATFSTGYGDGCYATYIGYAADGSICRLLTDFGIVNWWR